MSEHIIITENETVAQSWCRDASTFCLFAALIGIGVYLESSAMQWSGFIVAWGTIFAKVAGSVKKRQFTINEARAEIDRIESEME